jgi:hypothetical protein
VFVVQGPVDPREGLFVGRQQELALMEEWLRAPRCVGALLGARQTGKTSLLLRLQQRFGDQYHVAFVNLEAIEGAEAAACFTYIGEELIDQTGAGVGESGAAAPSDGATFLRFLRKLSDRLQRPRICVLLDEIGALPQSTGIRLAHTLRATFTNRHVQRELGRYQFVAAGSGDLLELTTGRNSPLRNVTETVYLSDLDAEEGRRLLSDGFAQSRQTLADGVAEAILGWTGGHPYWTQLLGRHAASVDNASSFDVDRIARALIASEDRNLPHLRRCLTTIPASASSALGAILEGNVVPFTRSDSHLAQLELLGIIRNDGGRAVMRNRLYDEALRGWRAHTASPAASEVAKRGGPARVFVSYAHADEALRLELGKHLSVLERQGLVAAWHDRLIAPGADWAGAIDAAIEGADIILLLVSADFIHSGYCYEIEMRRALERHAAGQALIIPIMVRPVSVAGMPFASMQSLPTDRRAVTDWVNRDSAYVDVVEGLRRAIAALGVSA